MNMNLEVCQKCTFKRERFEGRNLSQCNEKSCEIVKEWKAAEKIKKFVKKYDAEGGFDWELAEHLREFESLGNAIRKDYRDWETS